MKNKLKNLQQIFTPLIGGTIVSFIIKDSLNYQDMVKPFLAPPKIVFPVAWTILYLLIGYAYYKNRQVSENKETVILYYVGLVLNFIWPIIFFNFKLYLGALFVICLLTGFTYLLFLNYKKESPLSGTLLIFYLLWLVFATYLNAGIYILN